MFPLRGRLTKILGSCCIARLLVFSTEDRAKPILVRVESTGGPISAVLPLLSTMNGIHAPIATFLGNSVEGTAIVVGANAMKGCRVATLQTRLSFRSLAEQIDRDPREAQLAPMLVEILAGATGKPVSVAEKWVYGGAEFTAAQAMEAGLIDVISPQPVLPVS